MWRDGLQQPEHYLDLLSNILNSAAFSLPHFQQPLAVLTEGVTVEPGCAATAPQCGPSRLFSDRWQLRDTFLGTKAEGEGGSKKGRCTNFSRAPFLCFYGVWGKKRLKNTRFT